MRKEFGDIIDSKKLIMKVLNLKDFDKYSLKKMDFEGERFKGKENLFNFFDILSLSKPEIISEQVERFLKSGVDIITTNTENSNRYFLSKFLLEDLTYELNYKATKICREKVAKYNQITRNKPRFVAGTISNLSDKIEFDEAVSVYSEQIKAMLASKVDIFFLKDIKDFFSLKAILEALNKIMLKRNKYADILLSIDDSVILEKDGFKDISQSYTNVKLRGFGHLQTLDTYEDTEDNFAIFDFEKAEELDKLREIIKTGNLQVIGLQNNVSPEMVERVNL
jgi:methionine synthase I (cobalamin-dependent)